LERSKNILICPLEWGLGHATRMIPVAAELLKLNHNVIFASGDEHLNLIRGELPECSCLYFPGFKPEYSRHLPPYISMLFKIPQLAYHIILEHFRLNRIIRENKIDIVISDNRFGLWNSKIKTVYVTHMPLIPFPKKIRFLEPVGIFLHRQIIRRYNLCFIPDLPGDKNISGRLSHGINLPKNVRYIGILSRFASVNRNDSEKKDFRYNIVILSGPEPQKEILKQKLISLLKDKDPVTLILEGKPSCTEKTRKDGNVICYTHLPADRMKSIISNSEGIISRSGYTTIMDLITLNCSALLIPTPGQTEQEYLAEYLSEKGLFSYISQNAIKDGISFTLKKISDTTEITGESRILLHQALTELLDEPHHEPQANISKEKS
jgi:uncharacterized protein (TIGR00661 family)